MEAVGCTLPTARTAVRQAILPFLLAAGLLGCAARHVTPVPLTQPNDDRLTCEGIHTQIAENTARVATLLKQDRDVAARNGAAVASSLIWGAFFATALLDLSNEEQILARSLLERDDRLAALAQTKGCPP